MRRPLLHAAAGLALAALAALGIAAPASATADASSGVRVVTGDGTLTAAWPAVAGATSYTVRVSAKESLAGARSLTTTGLTARVRHLVNGRTYYVGVVPNGLVATARAVVRAAATPAVAAAGVPFPVDRVTAVSGPEQDQITVSWTGGGRATKVGVVAGSDVITNQRSFSSGWYPATTRSITITVPEDLKPYLGGGTGNPVWVKVVQSNSDSTVFGPSYSYDRKYRVSPTGTWAFAKQVVADDTTVTKLRVAELNTQSFGATERFSKTDQWAARAPRVAAYVNLAAPDLLMTAELATNVIDGCANKVVEPYRCGSHTQYADFARRLDGLKLAGTDAYARVMDRMRIGSGYWQGKVTDGAHVFYNPAKLTLLDHGYFAPAMPEAASFGDVTGLGVSGWSGTGLVGPDRWLSWAKLQTLDGKQFYAVAAHFPVGMDSSVVDVRAEEAQKLVTAIDRIAGTTPVVFGGDMNADAVRNPKAPQVVFMRDGWFDAAAVSDPALRSGMKVSTANGSGTQDGTDPGYGSKPIRHPYETSRIDYILLKNSPYTFRYANVLRLNADGTFRKDLQGTDHNMQLATIGIAAPSS